MTNGQKWGERERARGEKEDKLYVGVEGTMGKGSTRLKSGKNVDRKVREHEEGWQQEQKRLEHSTSSLQNLVDLIASVSLLLKSCGQSGAGKE